MQRINQKYLLPLFSIVPTLYSANPECVMRCQMTQTACNVKGIRRLERTYGIKIDPSHYHNYIIFTDPVPSIALDSEGVIQSGLKQKESRFLDPHDHDLKLWYNGSIPPAIDAKRLIYTGEGKTERRPVPNKDRLLICITRGLYVIIRNGSQKKDDTSNPTSGNYPRRQLSLCGMA